MYVYVYIYIMKALLTWNPTQRPPFHPSYPCDPIGVSPFFAMALQGEEVPCDKVYQAWRCLKGLGTWDF